MSILLRVPFALIRHAVKEVSGFLTLFCAILFASLLLSGCETPTVWYYKRDISPELREIVINTDIQKSDFRSRQLKVDKRTALVVFDPFVVTWLEGRSPMWSYEYMPDDHTEIDTSQRIVFVQVTPIMGFLEEGHIPWGWHPIDRVDARRDGERCVKPWKSAGDQSRHLRVSTTRIRATTDSSLSVLFPAA